MEENENLAEVRRIYLPKDAVTESTVQGIQEYARLIRQEWDRGQGPRAFDIAFLCTHLAANTEYLCEKAGGFWRGASRP
jgi:hypothetical protein